MFSSECDICKGPAKIPIYIPPADLCICIICYHIFDNLKTKSMNDRIAAVKTSRLKK